MPMILSMQRPRHPWPLALTLVWGILSLLGLLVCLSPWIWPEAQLLAASGALQGPGHVDGSCPLCGLTRAFLALGRGDLSAATAWHPWSIPLYGLGWLNGLLGLGWSTWCGWTWWQGRTDRNDLAASSSSLVG